MDFIVIPFAQFIGTIFMWILSIIHNHGLALIALSIVVNIILLPFYHIAEKIETKEKDVQEAMKPKLEEFQSVYKGYELYLYTNNVYRLHNYHPAYVLRGLVSLLIQIPFFMGAYAFLSNYAGFEGVSFLFLSNLAQPDGLFKLGGFVINILPFVMTAINLWSGYIYAKDSSRTEKMTIVGMGIFFLVILYNSPSSLLVYWTCNNIFSLVKTIVYAKLDERKALKGGVNA